MQLPSGLLYLAGISDSSCQKMSSPFPPECSISVNGSTTAQSANLEVFLSSSWLSSAAATGGCLPNPCLLSLSPSPQDSVVQMHLLTTVWPRALGNLVLSQPQGRVRFNLIKSKLITVVHFLANTGLVVGMWHHSGQGYVRGSVIEASGRGSLAFMSYTLKEAMFFLFLGIVLAFANSIL